MSAADQARAMLAELMGTSVTDVDGKKKRFDDPDVCKPYLWGCCPNDVLTNTRMEMGECKSIHDPALKSDYDKKSSERDYFYDIDAFEAWERFIIECDRRIEQSKVRLRDTQEDLSEDALNLIEKIHDIGEKIGTQLAEAERLGENGDVDGSLKLMDQVEVHKREKSDLEIKYRNTIPVGGNPQQQKLRVCEDKIADRRDERRRGRSRTNGSRRSRSRSRTDRDKERADRDKERTDRDKERADRDKEREEERAKREKERADRDKERTDRDKERSDRDKDRRRSRSRDRSTRRRSRSPRRDSSRSRRSRSRSRDRRRR